MTIYVNLYRVKAIPSVVQNLPVSYSASRLDSILWQVATNTLLQAFQAIMVPRLAISVPIFLAANVRARLIWVFGMSTSSWLILFGSCAVLTIPSSDIDFSVNGQSPASSYGGPSCPKTNCGTCYKVTYIGAYGTSASSPPPGAQSVIVQIIDSCPSTNAWNFCKTDIPANERCGTGSTNSLDIDMSAYKALTGQAWNVSLLECSTSVTY